MIAASSGADLSLVLSLVEQCFVRRPGLGAELRAAILLALSGKVKGVELSSLDMDMSGVDLVVTTLEGPVVALQIKSSPGKPSRVVRLSDFGPWCAQGWDRKVGLVHMPPDLADEEALARLLAAIDLTASHRAG